MNTPSAPHQLANGPFPDDDGWGWLYRAFDRLFPVGRRRRRVICRYFHPRRLERWRRGRIYRYLGVHLVGAVIPTGGIVIRRLTGARMAPYTLAATSRRRAREFFYRACVFESLHLPFLVALLALTVHRAAIGRWDLALEDTVINLLANGYPIMHHRRTRLRIVQLLDTSRRRPRAKRTAPDDE